MRPFLVLGGLCLLVAVACGGGSSKTGSVSLDVLKDLQPGTTLHTTSVHFQRHGPAEDILKLSDSYQPEAVYSESWITFDENGNVTSLRGETRAEDGTLYGSSRSDGNDI